MRALEFIRDHVTFKLPYDFSYHMKTQDQQGPARTSKDQQGPAKTRKDQKGPARTRKDLQGQARTNMDQAAINLNQKKFHY